MTVPKTVALPLGYTPRTSNDPLKVINKDEKFKVVLQKHQGCFINNVPVRFFKAGLNPAVELSGGF